MSDAGAHPGAEARSGVGARTGSGAAARPAGGAGLFARHGAIVAAIVAGLAALPGIGLPFLSDDWALVGALQKGIQLRTPFAYVRPLATAWLWLDLKLFGMSPAIVHLTSVALMAATAAVLVLLVRRLTGDARLAVVAGLVFALHPYHVENAAWVAARPDVLCAFLALLALWSHDRWLDRGRGLPLAALVLFEAALLSKEAAVTLPIAAFLLGLARAASRPPAGRPPIGPVLRGAGAMLAVALVHFLVIWPRLAGRAATEPIAVAPMRLVGRGADFLIATVLPAPTESIEARLRLWFGLAAAVAAILLWCARSGGRRVVAVAGVASAVFIVLLIPALVSFQARYYYLPGAAASVAIAALFLAMTPGRAIVLGLVLGAAWTVAPIDAWRSWYAAGRASRALVADTVAAADEVATTRAGADGRGLFIVNVPHRVRGAPVFPDLNAVTLLGTGRAMPVRYRALIDYPGAGAPGLAGPAATAVRLDADGATFDLALPPGIRSGLVWPTPGVASAPVEVPASDDTSLIVMHDAGRITARVTFSEAPADSIWYWSEGHLHRVVPKPAAAR